MTRRLAPLMVALAIGAGVSLVAGGQTQGPQTMGGPPPMGRGRTVVPPATAEAIKAALAEYERDDFAVERWARTSEGRGGLRYLTLVLATPPPAWDRNLAAFFLEAAVVSGASAAARAFPAGTFVVIIPDSSTRVDQTTLVTGRTMVVNRPAKFGDDKKEDRFEILWHQTALALLQNSRSSAAQWDYLDAIWPRIDEAMKRGATDGGRIPLARGIFAAGICCPVIFGERERPVMMMGKAIPTMADALALFERAAANPALAAEAYVRGGLLLRRERQDAEALKWFDRAPDNDDRLVQYVRHLTRGRLLDQFDRPAEAVEAYRAARAMNPESQLAGVGLAAALLRTGHADDAVKLAAEVRRTKDEGPDYMTAFDRADSRFVSSWLGEIRGLRR